MSQRNVKRWLDVIFFGPLAIVLVSALLAAVGAILYGLAYLLPLWLIDNWATGWHFRAPVIMTAILVWALIGETVLTALGYKQPNKQPNPRYDRQHGD